VIDRSREREGNCCLTPSEQFFSHIMARTSYISMRWWWSMPSTRPTHLVGFLYC